LPESKNEGEDVEKRLLRLRSPKPKLNRSPPVASGREKYR